MSRILFLGLAVSTAACATILDFQEPTDRVTATETETAAAPLDGGHSEPAAAPRTNATTSTSTSSSTSSSGGTATPIGDAGGEEPSNGTSTPVVTPPAPIVCPCPPSVGEWRGPFAVAIGAGDVPPACNGSFGKEEYVGHSLPIVSPAQCTCTCDPPASVTCGPLTTRFWDERGCTGSICKAESGSVSCANAECGTLKSSRSVSVESFATGGTCAPRESATIPPVHYKESIRLCAGPAVTCDAGACEVPSAPFSLTNRCVQRTGEHMCPAGYPVRKVFHHGVDDTRGCTACSCGGASGSTCGAIISTTTALLCASPEPVSGSCVDLPGSAKVFTSAPTPSGGSCPATGGAPTGGLAATGPSTVCCLE